MSKQNFNGEKIRRTHSENLKLWPSTFTGKNKESTGRRSISWKREFSRFFSSAKKKKLILQEGKKFKIIKNKRHMVILTVKYIETTGMETTEQTWVVCGLPAAEVAKVGLPLWLLRRGATGGGAAGGRAAVVCGGWPLAARQQQQQQLHNNKQLHNNGLPW